MRVVSLAALALLAVSSPSLAPDVSEPGSKSGASRASYLDFDGHTIMWLDEEFYCDPWSREGPCTTMGTEYY